MHDNFDYTLVAHHESGHAVASYILRVPIRSVYITPLCSECVSGLTFGETVDPNLVRSCVLVAAAGPAVEKELYGHYDTECCESDRELVEKRLLPRIENEEERRQLREDLPQLVEELIQRPRFLNAVRELAAEIQRQPGIRKELDGERAASIIRHALGEE
jgi:hypothetical protein